MKIAIAQINTTVGDIQTNLERACQAYSSARLRGADLVVFPELTLTGYPPEDLLFRGDFLKAAEEALHVFAGHTTACAAVIGTVSTTTRTQPPASWDRSDLRMHYNSAAFCRDGHVQGIYQKRKLPNYSVFDEQRYFDAGPELQRDLFNLDGKTIGVSICEDAWVGDSPLFTQGEVADVLVNISASPFHAGKRRFRQELMSNIARHTKTPIVYTNLVGGQDELVFDGGSFVVDADGALIATGMQFVEDIIYVDLALGDETADEWGPLWSPQEPMEEIYNALVLGTRDYLRKNGFHRALIGLSGGIDSALVAAIAAEAIGEQNVFGILMPSRYSSKGSLTDAWALAKNLGIRTIEIPIEAPHTVFENTLTPVYDALFPTSPVRNEDENVQARIRGTILMALSNRSGAIVLTTGNKSEMAVGYATLYGDMAGGFAVIKDVPKTTVFDLCRWMNDFDKEIIPQIIIDKPPSAELRPDQKDTDSLPEYDVLDTIIEAYVERDWSPRVINEAFKATPDGAYIEPELVEKVCRLVDLNEYKRRQAPPGIRISPKAFGKDRRLPITNGWS